MNGFSRLLSFVSFAAVVTALSACMGNPGDEAASVSEEVCASGGLVATAYSARPGTAITWTGSASCALPNPEYAFMVQPPGGSYGLVQAYSASNTFAWDTTGLALGTYDWQVWVREAGSSTSPETYGYRAFVIRGQDECSSVTASAAPSGSSAVGTTVTINALGNCGTATATYAIAHKEPGGSWHSERAYSTSAAYAWNTSTAAIGQHQFQIFALAQGSTASYESYTNLFYTITAGTPGVCSSTSSLPSPTNPVTVGTAVSITSTASCGASTATYAIAHRAPGGSWHSQRGYSTSAVYSWDTTGEPVGQHQFQVFVRAQGSTASYDAYSNVFYTIRGQDVCTSITTAAAPSSYVVVGQPVTITSAASCGTATPTYAIAHIEPGGSWHSEQPYSTSSSYVWDTTGAAIGVHQFQVFALAQGSTASYESYANLSYTVSATEICGPATLTPSPSSPATRGAIVNWTASAAGCSTPNYQFRIRPPGGAWTVAQDYSAIPTFAWDTTTASSGTYDFQVWIRAAGSVADYQTYAAASYAVQYTATSSSTLLTAGRYHTCLVRADSTVDCWGNNTHGEIGNGTVADAWKPVAVTGLSGVTSIAAGYTHTCAIVAGGAVQCWGENQVGQLGNGTTTSARTPVSVTGVTNAVVLAGGAGHACAVLNDGTMRCWGYNSQGQLGSGDTVLVKSTAVAVNGVSNAVGVAAGYYHTCALLRTGAVKCWGLGGALGDGTNTSSLVPVTVSGLGDAKAIAAAGSVTCALLYDGTVKCWGYNGYGGLGDGTRVNALAPVTVSALTGVSSISVEYAHSCAMLADGTARCWGANATGELGDGTTTDALVPVTVSTLVNGASIAASGAHSCALLNDSTATCWGYNRQGELGNNSTVDSWIPVVVILP